jgi:hypothetical protein
LEDERKTRAIIDSAITDVRHVPDIFKLPLLEQSSLPSPNSSPSYHSITTIADNAHIVRSRHIKVNYGFQRDHTESSDRCKTLSETEHFLIVRTRSEFHYFFYVFVSSGEVLIVAMSAWENNEEIEIFREYLRIPSVHPNIDYGKRMPVK